MALCGIVEAAMYFEAFRNIDLMEQGLYAIKTCVYYDETKQTKATPLSSFKLADYGVTVLPDSRHQCFESQILTDDKAFLSQTFWIRFFEEIVRMQEAVLFRLEIPVDVRSPKTAAASLSSTLIRTLQKLNSDIYVEFQLLFNSNESISSPSELTAVSTATYRVHGLANGFHHAALVHFDEWHFSTLRISIHSVLIDFCYQPVSGGPSLSAILFPLGAEQQRAFCTPGGSVCSSGSAAMDVIDGPIAAGSLMTSSGPTSFDMSSCTSSPTASPHGSHPPASLSSSAAQLVASDDVDDSDSPVDMPTHSTALPALTSVADACHLALVHGHDRLVRRFESLQRYLSKLQREKFGAALHHPPITRRRPSFTANAGAVSTATPTQTRPSRAASTTAAFGPSRVSPSSTVAMAPLLSNAPQGSEVSEEFSGAMSTSSNSLLPSLTAAVATASASAAHTLTGGAGTSVSPVDPPADALPCVHVQLELVGEPGLGSAEPCAASTPRGDFLEAVSQPTAAPESADTLAIRRMEELHRLGDQVYRLWHKFLSIFSVCGHSYCLDLAVDMDRLVAQRLCSFTFSDPIPDMEGGDDDSNANSSSSGIDIIDSSTSVDYVADTSRERKEITRRARANMRRLPIEHVSETSAPHPVFFVQRVRQRYRTVLKEMRRVVVTEVPAVAVDSSAAAAVEMSTQQEQRDVATPAVLKANTNSEGPSGENGVDMVDIEVSLPFRSAAPRRMTVEKHPTSVRLKERQYILGAELHIPLYGICGLTRSSVFPSAAASNDGFTAVSGAHLFVFVHGLSGNVFDLRQLKDYFALMFPTAEFYVAASLENNTLSDIAALGELLANEVVNYITSQRMAVARLSFIGHSLGAVIVRAALAHELMKPYLERLFTFVSLSAPHLGTIFSQSSLIPSAMWVWQKWSKSPCLRQLRLIDAPSGAIEDSYLFKLSQVPVLQHFKNIFLISSEQDMYVPFHSARIETNKQVLRDTKVGPGVVAMVKNILGPLQQGDPLHGEGTTIIRVNVVFGPTGMDLDHAIGRAAHIRFLDCHTYMEMLVTVFRHYFM